MNELVQELRAMAAELRRIADTLKAMDERAESRSEKDKRGGGCDNIPLRSVPTVKDFPL